MDWHTRSIPGILASALILVVILISSPADAELFAITDAGIVFGSSNDGITWNDVGALSEPAVVALAPGPTSGTLYALGRTGTLYRSINSGLGWTATGNAGASDCAALTVARNGDLLALTRTGDVARSLDAGANWTTESNVGASDCVAIAIGGANGPVDTLLVATASGDLSRNPNGASWTTVSSIGQTPVVDIMWGNGKLHALTDAGEVVESLDAGATWSTVSSISQVGMVQLTFTGGKFRAIHEAGQVAVADAAAGPWSWSGTTNQVFVVAFAADAPEYVTTVELPGAPQSGFALTARPSVFSDQVSFRLDGIGDATPQIELFDAAGRLVARVRTTADLVAPSGLATWDGRTESGVRAASGVYFARASAGPFSDTARIVLLR